MVSPGQDLEAFHDLIAGLSRDHMEVVRQAWPEARRAFTPDGLTAYLKTIRQLEAIGVTWSAIVTFLHEAPRLAREVGSASVEKMLSTALKVYGHTNQSVMNELFAATPIAARKLREPKHVAAFLDTVAEIAQRAPTGITPLLKHTSTLLEHLSVQEFRNWALLGIQSHLSDPSAQTRYFNLETPEARTFLYMESGGTLFADVRKRLTWYLRALWKSGTELRPFPATLQANRPYITPLGIHVPDTYRAAAGQAATELYRAATAHAAAHLVFSPLPMKRASLRPVQIALVALLEDARVELLAIREMPGLRRLWMRFHEAKAGGSAVTFNELAARLSRALLDPDYVDDNPWVQKSKAMFFDAQNDLTDATMCRRLGSILGNDIGQMRIQFNGKTYVIEPLYRDDNSHLWEADPEQKGMMMEEEIMLVKPELIEQEGGDTLQDPDDAESTDGIKPVGLSEPDEDTPILEADLLRIIKYPEWDYMINLARPQWCTVEEKRPEGGDPQIITEILERNEELLNRLDSLIRGSELRKLVKLRKQVDGDRFDLDAVVNAMIDVRSHRTPDPRLHTRIDRRERDLSVLVLLDLSESTNDMVASTHSKVLELAREATVLLTTAMERIGDKFAIHGFCSNGRHELGYYRFKDFDWPLDEHVRSRLAGMQGQLSTRMGGALRHAASWLKHRRSDKKLILLITDGEPHDIDVHDPKYLEYDAKKAVDEASKLGILTYCMSLDPKADAYVKHIFGQRNYMVLDHIKRLPEKLPALYLRLTR